MTKANQMYALIDARAASGKTVVDYCAEVGISRAKYNYWQLKRKRSTVPSPDEPAFVTLRPKERELTVTLSGGLRLNFAGDQLAQAADLLLQMDRRHAEF